MPIKSIHKLFSMKSDLDDGLSSWLNFLERPSSYELESDKRVLPEIEHLKGKIGEGDLSYYGGFKSERGCDLKT